MKTKDRLLKYLTEQQGEFLSGEFLSQKLAVSRAAIWKHIQKLRQQGFVIESVTNKGYMLTQTVNVLDERQIVSHLNTAIIGRKDILILKQTDSTNLQARQLASQNAAEGTIVIADNQTSGRGRLGRVWSSPPGGGIYLSLVLKPRVTPDKAPRITLMTAVSLAQALVDLTDISPRIKWPNDIMVQNKKLSGILTEIAFEMDTIQYVIVGIGINVNTSKDDFDQNSRHIATSIAMQTGQHLDRNLLIAQFLNRFEKDYLLFCQNEFSSILDRWKRFSDMIGKTVELDVLGVLKKGQVHDIDDNGALILKDDHGNIDHIFSGDVIKTYEK